MASRNAERVLRAKIDMASANFNLRDPVIYRILNAAHRRGLAHLPEL
jgi:glutaminyl-tRNA synthetase